MAKPIPPVIIIGMHRSGTTMITDMLQQLGLYMGWVLQENSEALFFVQRNERLMNACGGSWEYPEPVESLLAHDGMRRQARERLRRDIESLRFISYLGPERFSQRGGPQNLDFQWGWKDPRNTYLLPLWLELFPEARIIHIYRHPMDVARSLCVREKRSVEARVKRLAGDRNGKVPEGNSRPDNIRKETGLLYIYRRLLAVQHRFVALRQYEKLGVSGTLSYPVGLRLWAAYVGKCFEHVDRFPNPSISLKYEDFLDEPAGNLERLREFCGLPGAEKVKDICAKVRIERRYAYKSDESACRAFAEFRGNEWVRRLGYDQV